MADMVLRRRRRMGLQRRTRAFCVALALFAIHGSTGVAVSSTSVASAVHHKGYGIPVAAPPGGVYNHISHKHHSHGKGPFPTASPGPRKSGRHSYNSHAPFNSHIQPSAGLMIPSPSPAPSLFPHPSYHPGPVISPSPSSPPAESQNSKQRHRSPSPYTEGPFLSPVPAPFPTIDRKEAPTPSASTISPIQRPIHPPVHSPSGSFPRRPRAPWPQPVKALPPPPPNLDCSLFTCAEPLTNTPPGSPCACVLPMKVGLRVSVALYTFFPLVSEFAGEIASGVLMEQSQVRIMGANAASGEPEKTIVLINLVPRGEKFDNNTAYLTYEKLWNKKVPIKTSLFGDCGVLYVTYPGLPASPPTAPAMTFAYGNNSMIIHPLAADVKQPKTKHRGTTIAVSVVASVVALLLCIGAALIFMFKHRDQTRLAALPSQIPIPPLTKISGTGFSRFGSKLSSGSGSLSSSIATFIGSTKTFTLSELVRATNNFDDARIIGEGGFGLVYEGTLEDGTRVAVKVLKRDDQQGMREFLAEVEMLSRLHHRNLVKLIGVCTEDYIRCLIYELVPNGSVESHLQRRDKEMAPLDWNSRMKIALGAARCLAYLHEDSNPHVIHRDFKSSNILLEHDFTPKLCDFGLARTALGEENEHISTRVMGTFGYVAPEYAMTGHLLVKSDVYSYGVVLLELLTGRKPVDMLRPAGQENLVTWARPLLTSKDGLEVIVDPSLGTNFPFDNLAKVAAIASMCIQPEVSQRPFMGEVVQALKLVCSEHHSLVCCSQEELCLQDSEIRTCRRLDMDEETVASTSDMYSISARFMRDDSGSFRRYSSSGPLRTGRSQNFWQWVSRGFSGGSVSEHGIAQRRIQGGQEWP